MPETTRLAGTLAREQEIIPAPRPFRATMIKGLIPALPERGKIKIGMKGAKRTSQGGNEFQPPQKLDHFVITTLARGADGNFLRDEEMHARFGDKPTEIPVRLLYDDPALNFPTRYAAYWGRTLWCSGDGERAQRLRKDQNGQLHHVEIGCTCPLVDPTYVPQKSDPPRCKMNGSLSVIIDGASGLGGVWKFRSTSYNSINGLMSSMLFLSSITGGVLANIPLRLRVQPKQAVNPADGSGVLIYVVSLDFDGDVATLQSLGHQIALDRATTRVSIRHIETEARRRLALAPPNAPLAGDEAEDVVDEFYPEEASDERANGQENRPTRAQFKEPRLAGTLARGTNGPASRVASESNLATDPPTATTMMDPDEPPIVGSAETEVSEITETWEIVDPETGEATTVASASEAEAALMRVLNEALRKALNAKPETLAAKSIEAAAESNEGTIRSLPEEIYHRLSDRIAAAIDQVAKAHARKPAPATPTAEQHAPPTSAPVETTRDIEIKKLTFGPNRGVNWPKTVDAAIMMIADLSPDEKIAFRTFGANGRILAEINLQDQNARRGHGADYVSYIARINAALGETADGNC